MRSACWILSLALGKDGLLGRALALGAVADVRIAVHLPAAKEARGVVLQFQDEKIIAGRIAFYGLGARAYLANLTGKEKDVLRYDSPGAAVWHVRVEYRHGVVRARAWVEGTKEPDAWATARYTGESLRQPGAVVLLVAGALQGGTVNRLEVTSRPKEAPWSDEQRQAKRVLDQLHRTVRGLNDKGKVVEAVGKAREYLALSTKAFGAEHPHTITGLHNLGVLEHQAGELLRARQHFLTAVEADRRIFGDDHPETAVSYANLATSYLALGQFAAAREAVQQALRINQIVLGEDHEQQAPVLNTYAELLLRQADWEGARKQLERALALLQAHGRAKSVESARSFLNLGALAFALGNYPVALEHQTKALALFSTVYPETHPRIALCLEHCGESLALLGRAPEAQQTFAGALAIYKDHKYSLDAARCLGRMGANALRLGNDTQAQDCLLQGLEQQRRLLPAEHPDLALTLSTLALLYERRGNDAAAQKYLAEALRLQTRALGPEHSETVATLAGIGHLLCRAGKPAEAEPHFRQALAICRKVHGEEHPQTGLALNNLAIVRSQRGAFDEARQLLEKALQIAKKHTHQGLEAPEVAIPLSNLGLVHVQAGRPGEGWQYLADASGIFARLTAHLLLATAQREHATILARQRHNLNVLLSLAERAPALARQRAGELLHAVLDWKVLSGRALVIRQEVLALADNAQASELDAQLKVVRPQLLQELAWGSPGASNVAQRKRIAALVERHDELERQLALTVGRGYERWQQTQYATPAEVASWLPAGAVLLDLVRYERIDFQAPAAKRPRVPCYAACILVPEAKGKPAVHHVALGPVAPLDEAVSAWRTAVQQGKTDPTAEKVLYERLWKPLVKVLPKSTTRLLIPLEGNSPCCPSRPCACPTGVTLWKCMRAAMWAAAVTWRRGCRWLGLARRSCSPTPITIFPLPARRSRPPRSTTRKTRNSSSPA